MAINHNIINWGEIYCRSWFGDDTNRFSIEIDQSPECFTGTTANPEIEEEDFVIEIETTTENESVELPLASDGTYSGYIYWGDGEISVSAYINRTHIFAAIGVYQIIVRGTKVKFGYNNGGDKLKIKKLKQWGSLDISTSVGVFYGCSNLVVETTLAPDLSNVTSLLNMFRDCTLVDFDMSLWTFGTITNLSGFLGGKTTLDFSLSNADALLIRLAATLPTNALGTIGLNTIKYTVAAAAAVVTITTTKLWNLISGGQV